MIFKDDGEIYIWKENFLCMLSKQLARKYALGRVIPLQREKLEEFDVLSNGGMEVKKGRYLEKGALLLLEEIIDETCEVVITGYGDGYEYILAQPLYENDIFFTEVTEAYRLGVAALQKGEDCSKDFLYAKMLSEKLAEKERLLCYRNYKEVEDFDAEQKKFFSLLAEKQKAQQSRLLLESLKWRNIRDADADRMWIRSEIEEKDKAEWDTIYAQLRERFPQMYIASTGERFAYLTRCDQQLVPGRGEKKVALQMLCIFNTLLERKYSPLTPDDLQVLMSYSLEGFLRKEGCGEFVIPAATFSAVQRTMFQDLGYTLIQKKGLYFTKKL